MAEDKTKTIVLGAKGYQPATAQIKANKTEVSPFEWVTLEGKDFTGFLQRGNPGVAILIDGKPLTGATLDKKGRFKIRFQMPPFEPGWHILDIFGILLKIFIKEPTGELITQGELKSIVLRDFKISPDCHLLFSDSRYRVTPIDLLQYYIKQAVIPHMRYVAEFFDCDNFANAMSGDFVMKTYPKGYAFGEIWVSMPEGGHAINCVCVKDKDGKVKMVLVEPQTGQIFDMPKDWEAFMIKI